MSTTAPWTVGRLLQWTADYLKGRGADSPRLDAEILLAEALGCQRIQLYTAFEDVPRRTSGPLSASWFASGRRELRWPISSGGGSSIRSASKSVRACSSRGRRAN